MKIKVLATDSTIINILGTEYDLVIDDKSNDILLTDKDGYCDESVQKIVIRSIDPNESEIEDLNYYVEKVLRHEIIHAFLIESGLSSDICDWHCEEMVDWLAMQSPKIFKLFEELKIM